MFIFDPRKSSQNWSFIRMQIVEKYPQTARVINNVTIRCIIDTSNVNSRFCL